MKRTFRRSVIVLLPLLCYFASYYQVRDLGRMPDRYGLHKAPPLVVVKMLWFIDQPEVVAAGVDVFFFPARVLDKKMTGETVKFSDNRFFQRYRFNFTIGTRF